MDEDYRVSRLEHTISTDYNERVEKTDDATSASASLNIGYFFRQSDTIVKRDPSVLYYDCTNFYLEFEQADDGIVDEVTGEAVTGLRQYGFSLEHRPNPIVEMGLFMDSRGILIDSQNIQHF